MENTKSKNLHGNKLEEEDFEDTLSLSDLPIHDDDNEQLIDNQNSPLSSSYHDDNFFDFEFSVINNTNPETIPPFDDIIFCGKIVPQKLDKPTNLLTKNSRSYSFHVPSSKSRTRSSSLPATGSYQKHSSNNSGRKQKVLIGLARIPSEMDLSDIKKRQSRRKTPAPPMFPAVNGEKLNKAGGDGEEGGSGSVSGYWCLLQPFKSGSNLIGALARASFGCLPHV